MSEILFRNIELIYFIYGLAFLTLGMILLTQVRAAGKSKYKLLDILLLLASFAIIHSVNEFLDMFKLIYGEFSFLNNSAIVLLVISNIFLFSFGYTLVSISGRKPGIWLPIVAAVLFLALPLLKQGTFTIWTISARYFIGFIGSILSSIGLYLYSRKEAGIPIKKYLYIASISIGLYGLFAGIIVPKADFFPASVLNNDSFVAFAAIPPQLFRALLAILTTWAMWHIVDVFNLEKETERQRVFETLKFERDKAKNYLKIAEIILVALNKHGKVILINQKGADILGYPEDEIIGKNWFDNFLPESHKSDVKTVFKGLMAGEIKLVERYENPIVNKDGEERLIYWHNTIVKDDTGKMIGTLSSGEDVTEKKIAEIELKKSVNKLKLALEETVHVLASIVETKDSYTAEHQKKVAKLATAIAKEIGLTKNEVKSVYVAAILHDIGKLFIPAEILNKPNRLSELEFSLIKTHSQVGFDILKSVDFPWPVAKIIVQHHERINGSGYPLGIKGNEMTLEAKIIAVADVVEAITSHRPYRPALGLETALIEISQNSGALYDKKIVDACLKLFNVKKFKFEKDENNIAISK